MKKKEFKRKKCPWIELKETDQGVLFWCEKCGAFFNEGGDWEDNGPTLPTAVDTDTLHCPDRGLVP